GSPTEVADELERWVDEAGVDGFNLAYVTTPGTFVDFARHVVPELRRRGRLPDQAERTTLRERLGGAGPLLVPGHPGAAYRPQGWG
ncbi:5,10-methylene tetrahydromethanopterin reductase, partial [Streptomyces sp. DSM 41699]|nr:5,10-methylene tetrahydromethanopterin reductase [Streptomyces sp. DSM 41699]